MKKGFGGIGILIAIGIIAVLGGGYYYQQDKDLTLEESDDFEIVLDDVFNVVEDDTPVVVDEINLLPIMSETILDIPEGYQQYKSNLIPISFIYPQKFTVQDLPPTNEDKEMGILGSVVVSLTKYDDKRDRPVDCGGFVLQEDEVSIKISLHTDELPYFNKYEQHPKITLGNKTMNVHRGIGGMCGETDGYLLRLNDENIIEIYVSPSETQYMKKAEEIISSLQF